jgi:hypothetical protein
LNKLEVLCNLRFDLKVASAKSLRSDYLVVAPREVKDYNPFQFFFGYRVFILLNFLAFSIGDSPDIFIIELLGTGFAIKFRSGCIAKASSGNS